MPLTFFKKWLAPAVLSLTMVTVLYAVEPRSPFSVPLAMLAYTPSQKGVTEKVIIWYDKVNESWEISATEARHLIEKGMQNEDETFREPQGQEFLMNAVEAQVVNRVCKTLVKTLDGFESDLKKNRWDKCRYLDSYLASFYFGFYHLITIVRCSRRALPEITCPSDSLYDRSLESPKSDARVAQWRRSPEYIVKLRIAAKELMYQIKQWQKKELDNSKRDVWKDQSGDFVEAYEFFIRLYFNLPPNNRQR